MRKIKTKNLKDCKKRKRKDVEKEVTSHPGTQEMGQQSSQWRHRQLLQSYTTEEKSNCQLRKEIFVFSQSKNMQFNFTSSFNFTDIRK